MPLSMSVPLVAAAVSIIGIIGGTYLYQKNKNNKLPEEWVHIGHLKQLYAYPIKSCAPIILNQAECTFMGLKDDWLRDRAFMVIDTDENSAVSIKSYPKLVTIKPTLNKSTLTLQHPNMEIPLEINIVEVMATKNVIHINLETSPVTAYDCGEEANAWINLCLDNKDNCLRLVYYPAEKSRAMFKNGQKIFKKLKTNDLGAFAAVCTYHVINEASINDLNSRLQGLQVDEVHFRPNIVLSGCNAFDEDKWKYVKIGESIFEVIFPCFRCLFTTMDPLTGRRNKNKEPLATLKTYRLASDPEVRKVTKNDPLMGIYMALRRGPGILSVNQPVYVKY